MQRWTFDRTLSAALPTFLGIANVSLVAVCLIPERRSEAAFFSKRMRRHRRLLTAGLGGADERRSNRGFNASWDLVDCRSVVFSG
jgi:hypothetical protein